MFNKKSLINLEIIFAVVVLILFVWLRLRLIDISFERDEGEYAYAGQQILRGALPYRDFYNMKMPGTYYCYALIFSLLGESVRSVHIGLMFINLLSASFIFLSARKLFDKKVGFYSAGIFLLFTMSASAQGWTANAEHFVILPATIGIWACVEARERKSIIWYFLSGFMMASATICKQQGLNYIFLVPLWHILADFDKNTFKAFLLKFMAQMTVYGIGIGSALGILAWYVFQNNIYTEFIYWTFKYATAYVSTETPLVGIWRFRPIFWDSVGFWLLFFSAIYLCCKKHDSITQKPAFIAFFIIGFMSISVGWYYRPHYFQLLFPFAAIISGYMIVNIENIWPFKWVNTQRWAVLSLVAYCIVNSGYLFFKSSDEILFDEYGTSYFSEWRRLGEKLPQIVSNKNGKIALLGAEPQIMFHSKQESASGFMYHYPFYENQKYAAEMRELFIKEVEENNPEILIYQTSIEDEENNKETTNRINEWLIDYKQGYELIGKMYHENGEPRTIWFNNDSLSTNRNNLMAEIYKRKSDWISQKIPTINSKKNE